jgi:N,N'-diacetyllegionaminate synthase
MSGSLRVVLGGRALGDGERPYVICEAGLTNYGDPALAKKQIDAAVAAGADAVKFQLWRTEELVSRVAAARLQSSLGYDWFDRLKSKELPLEAFAGLKAYAEDLGIAFTATPHDSPSLDVLDRDLDVPFLKIGSGEAHNLPFLRAVASRGKPVVISFGFQSDAEVQTAVAALEAGGAPVIVPLHCVTAYPTPFGLADLTRIARLRKLTGRPVGYSDHTVGRHALLGAVALGACLVEKHLTFDKADPRSLDNPGALLPDEFVDLVRDVQELWQALSQPGGAARTATAEQARAWAGQSIVAARALPAGAVLERDMLRLKRPAAGGLGPEQVDAVVGRRLGRAVAVDEQITASDLEA